jgi:L-alanine-DL-glutamate epimerase-like enolase superfamily enzyme
LLFKQTTSGNCSGRSPIFHYPSFTSRIFLNFKYEDIFDHSKLQRELKTPICLDESIHSLDDIRAAIEPDSCRIINIKPGRVPKKPGIGVEVNMRMLEKVTDRSENFRS